MQDHVNDKTVTVVIKGAKITGKMLAKALKLILIDRRRKRLGKPTKTYKGKQSFKKLRKQGAELTDIEITNKNIKSFERIAKKYDIDFSLKKDSSKNPPRWLVSFKAKDSRALSIAFKEYAATMLKRAKTKKSIIQNLKKMKTLSASLAKDLVKNIKKEREL